MAAIGLWRGLALAFERRLLLPWTAAGAVVLARSNGVVPAPAVACAVGGAEVRRLFAASEREEGDTVSPKFKNSNCFFDHFSNCFFRIAFVKVCVLTYKAF